jgi:hypothetical protein
LEKPDGCIKKRMIVKISIPSEELNKPGDKEIIFQ